MKLRLIVALPIFIVSTEVVAADLTIEQLSDKCDKKQFVMSSQGEIVGDKLNDYCSGYLAATLDALRNIGPIKCDNTEPQEANYLLSVFKTYIRKSDILSTDSASRVLLNAYSRAFGCHF
jgi:hypothetical protein